jgi:hypothetical protein
MRNQTYFAFFSKTLSCLNVNKLKVSYAFKEWLYIQKKKICLPFERKGCHRGKFRKESGIPLQYEKSIND